MKQKPEFIVRVYHPELTPEEYDRRMERIKRATVNLIIAAEKVRRGI